VIRLALGSQPRHLLKGVIAEGAVMAVAGEAFGFVVARLAGSSFLDVKMPGVFPVVLSAFLLLTAAVVASMLPAERAARIDIMRAIRAD
jgi:putative ABC transport system permease protein